MGFDEGDGFTSWVFGKVTLQPDSANGQPA